MRLNSLLFALPLALASPLLNSSDVSATLPTTEEKAPLSRWIVTLEKDFLLDNVLDSILALVGVRKSSVIYTYDMPGYQGFVIGVPSLPIEIPPLADLLLPLPSIKSVEKDSIVKISAVSTQNNAPYGLARLSSRANAAGTVYKYDATAGTGTFAYVVDTGINTQHQDFNKGRAILGASFPSSQVNSDGNGHGTHVAGTIGGTTYGVAKNSTLIAVKVLSDSGSGYLSDVIAGIEWAVNNATASKRIGKSVMNLSLGSAKSQVVNDAISAAVRAGMFVAVAAGNNGADAAGFSPASEPLACTVGAIDSRNAAASFSNYGTSLDIWAPGVSILSTWIGSNSATATLSGTSMASPHIAGLAAAFYGQGFGGLGREMCGFIQAIATRDIISPAPHGGSVNYVAYNGIGA
ncbi:hypothetical protein KC315_g14566 [Hortaea werneckii]|nr:hypothetical protein KC324_g8168 [Hortaea werneckii]KAI7305639.1 hypothetical protein KC315_g14566 [Hortaea werneckii]KAI7541769.1 hypothetical protein KC331_g8370 [Hortaea werneckii]KAI7574040.1 hypothetical protein KC316_g11620 [Hortaea werneckii]KAI7712654.1 hypothetical protein KC353_g8113 [Hortaea werneckii]